MLFVASGTVSMDTVLNSITSKYTSILQGVQDKKLRHMLKSSDAQAQRAARKAARSELLLQEEPG